MKAGNQSELLIKNPEIKVMGEREQKKKRYKLLHSFGILYCKASVKSIISQLYVAGRDWKQQTTSMKCSNSFFKKGLVSKSNLLMVEFFSRRKYARSIQANHKSPDQNYQAQYLYVTFPKKPSFIMLLHSTVETATRWTIKTGHYVPEFHSSWLMLFINNWASVLN